MFKYLFSTLIFITPTMTIAKTSPDACELHLKLTEDTGIETIQTFHLWKGASAYSEFPVIGEVLAVKSFGRAKCPLIGQNIHEKLSTYPKITMLKENQNIKIRIEYIQHFFKQPSKDVTLIEIIGDKPSNNS